ncbi:putative cyclin domain-containing protein [Helianthus anomalus]
MKPQNPTFPLDDHLLCDEHESDFNFDHESQISKRKDHLFTHFEHDLSWDEDELSCLLSKEKNCYSQGGLIDLRKESVDWMIRVCNCYGFVAMTTVLAVDYFDRFLLSGGFKRGVSVSMPWMNQLAAVACLSLASKVEEIQAPVLMELQVEGAKFVFESKTIMRMELLVLDSLQWKMNPVTPFAFTDYIMRRLGLIAHRQGLEFVQRCERTVLAVVNDSRYLDYLPSVIAAATMALVIKEVDPDNAFDYLNGLKDFLEISEEKVDECVKFILEVSDNHGSNHFVSQKRKYQFAPASPNGVIDSYFCSDNSNDSWAVASTSPVSSSPEPLWKKIRARDEAGLTDSCMVSNVR